jgi:F-type H+-transporting ATPase subunit a
MTNSMVATLLVCFTMCIFGVLIGQSLKRDKPTKIQNLTEWFIVTVENIANENIGSKSKARPYIGLVLTLFLFIVLSSWFGLIPGVLHLGINEVVDNAMVFVPIFRAPTTDLNATIALAIIAFCTIQYAGFSSLGFTGYLGKFIILNQGPLNFIIGLLELLQEFVRLISFSFRLFGNIFAGEVLIAVLLSLTKFNFGDFGDGIASVINYVGVPVPTLIILMEVIVAMIQAYVFVSLMTVFISIAADKPHH